MFRNLQKPTRATLCEQAPHRAGGCMCLVQLQGALAWAAPGSPPGMGFSLRDTPGAACILPKLSAEIGQDGPGTVSLHTSAHIPA